MFKGMACYPPAFIIYIEHISSKAAAEAAQVLFQPPWICETSDMQESQQWALLEHTWFAARWEQEPVLKPCRSHFFPVMWINLAELI